MSSVRKPESARFKGPSKWVQYLLARCLITFLQRLPIKVAYKLGRGIGWICWKQMSKRRKTVKKNLEIVNAWIAAQGAHAIRSADCDLSLDQQIREVFQRAGANLFSGFTFNQMSLQQVESHIKMDGFEHLRAALAQGKGAIILLAHMGPWEALTQLPAFAARHGIEAPFGAMYRPLNNAYLDNWLKSQREAQGARLFSRAGGFHKPVDFIRGGGMLGILADQKMREGPTTTYFGVEVASSPIPGLFHRRSGAPMLALSVATVAPMRWELRMVPVVVPEALNLSSREALARLGNQALEQRLACSPCDCLWMHKRF